MRGRRNANRRLEVILGESRQRSINRHTRDAAGIEEDQDVSDERVCDPPRWRESTAKAQEWEDNLFCVDQMAISEITNG